MRYRCKGLGAESLDARLSPAGRYLYTDVERLGNAFVYC
jgi:hypothetical protein